MVLNNGYVCIVAVSLFMLSSCGNVNSTNHDPGLFASPYCQVIGNYNDDGVIKIVVLDGIISEVFLVHKSGALIRSGSVGFVSIGKLGSDGLAAFVAANGRSGYLDHNGSVAIPPTFSRVKDFESGVAAVAMYLDENSYQWGVIDVGGNIIVDFLYETPELALASIDGPEK